MEQRFSFINVNERFDMTTPEGMKALMDKILEIFPACTSTNYDPYDRNGYIEVVFLAPPVSSEIGDVTIE